MVRKIRCIGVVCICCFIVVLYMLMSFTLYNQDNSVPNRLHKNSRLEEMEKPQSFQSIKKSSQPGYEIRPTATKRFSTTSARAIKTTQTSVAVKEADEILDWLNEDKSNANVALSESLKKKNGFHQQNDGAQLQEYSAQNKQKDPRLSSSPSSLFGSENVVRNCLTRDIISHVLPDLQTHPLKTLLGPTIENSNARRRSFVKVFESHAWGRSWDGQNRSLDASGMGATLYWTQELIGSLHVLVNDLKQTFNLTRVRILDVPCGDFTWMQRFLSTRSDIDYVGVDIVPAIIENHQKTFKNFPWKFRLGDVLEDNILNDDDEVRQKSHGIAFDIIVCRTLAQHLYNKDIITLFKRLMTIGARVLVTTSFYGEQKNEELVNDPLANPGRFRPLNIELPPVSLVAPLCMVRDGPGNGVIGGWDHFIGVWKLPLLQVRNCREPNEFRYPGTEKLMYSCAARSL